MLRFGFVPLISFAGSAYIFDACVFVQHLWLSNRVSTRRPPLHFLQLQPYPVPLCFQPWVPHPQATLSPAVSLYALLLSSRVSMGKVAPALPFRPSSLAVRLGAARRAPSPPSLPGLGWDSAARRARALEGLGWRGSNRARARVRVRTGAARS